MNDSRFFERMRGEGPFAEQVNRLFKMACQKAGIADERHPMSTAAFRRPQDGQLSLF